MHRVFVNLGALKLFQVNAITFFTSQPEIISSGFRI